MKQRTWIILVILGVLAGWLVRSTYFSQEAKDCRALERKNKVLRLLVEQRGLQFKGMQLDAILKPRDPNR